MQALLNPSRISPGRSFPTRLYHLHPCGRGRARWKYDAHLASKSITCVIHFSDASLCRDAGNVVERGIRGDINGYHQAGKFKYPAQAGP